MSIYDEWEPEKQLSTAANLPELDDARKEALFAATTRVIRGRRRWRAGAQLAAIVLAFVSGMLTMAQWRAADLGATSGPAATKSATAPAQHELLPATSPAAPLYADPEALAVAYDAADAQERLRLLRGAGDYELNTRSDVRSALAFYEQWVRLADDTARTQYDESDTWLLASLKYGE